MSDNILALERNISEYTAARENAIDALNAPIDTEYNDTNNGAKIDAEALAAEYTKKYQKAAKAIADGEADFLEQQEAATSALKEGWESLEHEYAVGTIATEAELYEKKKALWNEYGNTSLNHECKRSRRIAPQRNYRLGQG